LRRDLSINTERLRSATTFGEQMNSINFTNQIHLVLSRDSWLFRGHIAKKGPHPDNLTFVFNKKIRIPRKIASDMIGPEVSGGRSLGQPHAKVAILGFIATDIRNPLVNNKFVLTKRAIPFNAVAIVVYLNRTGELLYVGVQR